MKLSSISPLIHNRRGEIGTIAVLIGMVVVGLGILVGSQIRNQNINIAPRAAAPQGDALWSSAKPAPGNIYPWTNGPTTGWESYLGQRVYICKGEWCWTILRTNNQTILDNNGSPFQMSGNSAYSTVKAAGDRLPWSGGGPTAAWTWDIQYNGQAVNETLICNGSLCWRYIRYANGSGEWRDGGSPINLATLAFWKDKPNLYTNNGPSVGWTDPINKKTTLCNGGYCESLSYANWTWLGQVSPYPSGKGVTQYTSAWTSPVTNIQTLCTLNSCWQFTLKSGGGTWGSSPILITPPAPTATTKPVATATRTPIFNTPTKVPTKPVATATRTPIFNTPTKVPTKPVATATRTPIFNTPTKVPTKPAATATRTPIFNTPTKVPTKPVATATRTPIFNTPTKVPTKPVATATKVTDQCPRKLQGDADCNGIIDYVDFVCWRGELIKQKPANCVSADFTGANNTPDGVVNSADFNVWRKTFLDPLNK